MRLVWLLAALLVAGCAAAPPAAGPEAAPAAVSAPPVIEKAWAPQAVRDGTYWQLYLKAADADCDLAAIYARVYQLGLGGYRVQQFNLGEAERCGAAGRISFLMGPDFLWSARFEVDVWVQDKAGNASQRLKFPVVVNGPPALQPPAEFSGPEFERTLGNINIRLRSPIFDGGRPGLGPRLRF